MPGAWWSPPPGKVPDSSTDRWVVAPGRARPDPSAWPLGGRAGDGDGAAPTGAGSVRLVAGAMATAAGAAGGRAGWPIGRALPPLTSQVVGENFGRPVSSSSEESLSRRTLRPR